MIGALGDGQASSASQHHFSEDTIPSPSDQCSVPVTTYRTPVELAANAHTCPPSTLPSLPPSAARPAGPAASSRSPRPSARHLLPPSPPFSERRGPVLPSSVTARQRITGHASPPRRREAAGFDHSQICLSSDKSKCAVSLHPHSRK
jgi:hypothetical protein